MNFVRKIEKTILEKYYKVGVYNMISNGIKMVVAQNCTGYESKYLISFFSMSNLSESCDSCQSYMKGICAKELFDEMVEIIKRN
jgi:hypothetical protein